MKERETTQQQGKRGLFVLSLDTEIAWGTFDNGGLHRYTHHFNHIRPIIKDLVALLDKYQIPTTWAFVGHLLLDHCERSPSGVAHPEILRPQYDWYPQDWHHCDPGTNIHDDPWWYGTDLLQMVLNSETTHEIGSHTFSHIIVDDPACTHQIFQSQMQACVDLHRSFGLKLNSFVYPRNGVALLETLVDLGISVYRGPAKRPYEHLHPRMVKLLRNLDRWLALPPATYPIGYLDEGDLMNIPASMYYMPRDGFRRTIPISSRVRQARLGLRKAAEKGELFHLWFHPFNLGSDPRLFHGLDQVFQTAAALRDAGKLSIVTMEEAANMVKQQA